MLLIGSGTLSTYYDADIKIKKLKIPPYGTNCYIVACPDTGEAVIIDTPGEASIILTEAQELHIRYIIITHTHADHLGAFSQIRKKLGAPVAVNAAEATNLPSPPDLTFKNGDMLNFGTLSLTVIYTPGHSPGSICLLIGRHLFAGDTLFPGGPGHTRTPAAFKQIIESITQKLLVLPEDTIVYPGHGDDTTIVKAKQEFAAFSSRPYADDLYGDVLWLTS
jgi:glyoxylase-like metal-dependent hydrolase (beta-lactamase superfamily II)